MKGLVLNHYYAIEKGIKSSVAAVAVLVIAALVIQEDWALRFAVFLPFLLIPVHAFEVLKRDVLSGWNRFEITLPVKRKQIVQSKYATFLLLLLVSLALPMVLYTAVHFLIEPVFTDIVFNFLMRGMGLVLCLAAIVYPLTFKWGTEKSDMIFILSLAFSFGTFGGVSGLLALVIGTPDWYDQVFSLVFLIVALASFAVSYMLSQRIYKKKEF
ncbi:ABC-2 transporter permease [Alteribacter natronophilus]|uniref:ABC-2 transporter permease n=1 Tax=Alteribacter natronophilus TaxID=2583810 RepID=UPI00110E260B|nr:ABC-2 transporter permease [Alteribacter natronophilus]TMW70922.1 ABC-2 transporter permease [Alteribacter natronophilus]